MKNKKHIPLLFFSIIIIIPLAIFGAVSWYQRNISGLPFYGEKYTIETSKPFFTVPDFQFTNQVNAKIDQSFIKNKIWVANYFFTSCPSICPKMMHNLIKVQNAFAGNSDVRLISFTVDPEHDSPQRLFAYAKQYGINALQWQLATGSKIDLYSFARKGLFVVATDGDGGAGDFIHSDNLVLVDKDNHIRGYYDGTNDADVKKMMEDIKTLQ
ncbi:MAG: SCO family protein [Arachidicoccus sp.]|nr:SCO family protein [Arachidicoccus sp.]